ncbi:MAG TPA: ABC transporter permease subunit [Candidatus Limiplasma sp.]|nr:ABC transporter permease subunit [Candidatus Limiplasma sp.]
MKRSFRRDFKREKWLYFMMVPGLLYYLIFKYGPMFGLVMAFQDFMPYLGFLHSKFVGIKYFIRFFSSPSFGTLFRNTLILGIMNIVFFFPIPIIFALMMNEIVNKRYKRVVQTFIYIPHFISWVVVYAITYILLNVDDGVINSILQLLGLDKISFLTNKDTFRPVVMMQIIWKESGWGTIIFLAALTNIDPQLYQAASVDGANRFQQFRYVTLPSLTGVIVTMLILRMGSFLDTGYEQLLLMVNSLNRSVGEVFDTYVYFVGIEQGQFSYTAAVGMFKSVISLALVVCANYLAKRAGEEGIY